MTEKEEHLVQLKKHSNLSFAVIFPARNEEKTVGNICSSILKHKCVMNLIDELVVMNDRSTDNTYKVTMDAFNECNNELYRAKCHIFNTTNIATPYNYVGKGAVLWKSLLMTKSSHIIFIDSDHEEYDSIPIWILNFIKCYLLNNNIKFIKGYFSQSIIKRDGASGRVSELVMIPLISILFPNIPSCIHPGCGEQSATRDFLININNFPAHYAIECCLWIEANLKYDKTEIKQIDLITKTAKKQSLTALRSMSASISSYLIRKRFNLFADSDDLLGKLIKTQDLKMNDSTNIINIDTFPSIKSFINETHGKSSINFNKKSAELLVFIVSICIICFLIL